MTFPVQVGPSTITINRDDRVLVCQPDARVLGEADGFFTRDTRFVSGYDLWINGRRPILLASAPIQSFSSRFEFTNDATVDSFGLIDRQSLALRIDRTVADAIHEDIDIANYASRPVRLTIEIAVLSDFADIFDVSAARSCAVVSSTVAGSGRAASCGRPTSTVISGASSSSPSSAPARQPSSRTADSCSWRRSRRRASGTHV